jgi:transaldolase
MKLFLDTANIEAIKDANDMGAISGVTTNPSIIAKEGRNFQEVLKEITKVVDGPISGEVKATTLDVEGMVKEAREIASLHPNIVVKLPTTKEGLKACKLLSNEGIKVNMTLIFNVPQALLAANAGATFVSPFVGRLDDISMDGIAIIKEIAEVFKTHNISAKIISASIRHPIHVIESAKAGAHYATVPYHVLLQMYNHPLTSQGIEKFTKDYLETVGE